LDTIQALLKHTQVRIILLAAIGIVLASWFRVYIAGTIQVDDHGLSGIPVYIVFITYSVAIWFYGISLYRLWCADTLSSSQIRVFAYLMIGIFTLMLPMLSNDIFSLLAYGDASNKGVDVYTDTQSLHVSPLYDYVSKLWKTAPCVYGPVCLYTSKLAGLICPGNVFVALAAYKILALFWAIIFVEVMSRISTLLETPSCSLLLILLNPILLMQGIAQLHCDAIAATCVVCIIYTVLTEKWILAFAFLAFAILSKMSYVLILPFLFVSMFIKAGKLKDMVLNIAIGVMILTGIICLFYLPLYTSPKTITQPFHFLTSQGPSKSFTEIAGYIVSYASQVFAEQSAKAENLNLHSPITGISQEIVWNYVSLFCKTLALVISAILFYGFWKGERNIKTWIRTYLRLLMLFLLFYSPIFYAWYPMLFLPFIILENEKTFITWVVGFTFLVLMQDTVCFVTRSGVVYVVVLGLTFLSVASYVWRFRKVYFLSL
jgi:hypothetical protein